MKRNLGIAAFALALSAGVASAENVNPGLQQIANYLGLDSGAYSAMELHELLSARRDGDQAAYTYLLNGGKAPAAETVSAGRQQLAALAGVNADAYTTDELVNLRAAQIAGDIQGVNFYLKHENRNTVNFPVVRMGRNG